MPRAMTPDEADVLHPDRGGSAELFANLVTARDRALEELGHG